MGITQGTGQGDESNFWDAMAQDELWKAQPNNPNSRSMGTEIMTEARGSDFVSPMVSVDNPYMSQAQPFAKNPDGEEWVEVPG